MFFLSGREMIKKGSENSRLRTSGLNGEDPYTGGWMASCRNRTCCANLPVIAVHTYTHHKFTQAQANIHTQVHVNTKTWMHKHTYGSTRPHSLTHTKKWLNSHVSLRRQMEAVSMPWVSCSKWKAHEVVFPLCDYSHMLTVLGSLVERLGCAYQHLGLRTVLGVGHKLSCSFNSTGASSPFL